jgi:hypothetical protein
MEASKQLNKHSNLWFQLLFRRDFNGFNFSSEETAMRGVHVAFVDGIDRVTWSTG